MINIYFDEKGPQETFSASKDPKQTLPIKHGSDNMKCYILTGFSIPENNMDNFSNEFHEVIGKYLNESKRKKTESEEIKGEYIFKKFNRGIASIHYHQAELLTSLYYIYEKYNCNLVTVSSNKYSMAISAKLGNWFFHLAEQNNLRISLSYTKFSITKYIEESASKEVIENLLNPNSSLRDFLLILKNDFKRTIAESTAKKYEIRNENLFILTTLIDIFLESSLEIQPYIQESRRIRWDTIGHILDLWFTEKELTNPDSKYRIFLDRGIPKSIFEKTFNENQNYFDPKINDGLDSALFPGIQFADIFASLTGKMLSGIVLSSKPRNNITEEQHLIDISYYELQNHQFKAAKIINNFLFKNGVKFGFSFDVSSGDEYILKTYLAEICSFDSFEGYKNINPQIHAKNHFQRYCTEQKNVLDTHEERIINSKQIYGSFEKAVADGMILPL